MQELIINISKCISTSPELFDGILKLRLGWILDCMQQELNDMNDDNQDKIVKNSYFLYSPLINYTTIEFLKLNIHYII